MELRLGPMELRIGKPQAKLEVGATGTMFMSGVLVEEEYNPDLRGEKAIKVFERMRRSDGQVKGTLLACTLPLREARWDVVPAGDGARDAEIAEFVRANLFEQMSITWDDFLSQALLMLPFGFSVFEKVWELVDGRYRWRKLAPRLPKTIYKWDIDPEGGLRGLTQRVYKEGLFQECEIPVEKLLVFTNEKEGSNFQGVSLLRAAYKHWYYKDQLYRIDGIAAERHGVGVAVFKLPTTATQEGSDSDYGRVGKLGEQLHTHERSYLALPDTYDFELKGVSGQLHNIIGSIEHHDNQIGRSILAQFLGLGSSKIGSYALSADQSGFFLMALRATGKNVCATMNRHAIKQMVDYNWDVKAYPQLTVSGLEHRDLGAYAKAITDVVNAGLIKRDDSIEDELRKFLHLPARKKAEAPKRSLRLAGFRPYRPLRGAETHVAFGEINDRLDTAEDNFVKAAKEIQAKQIGQIVDQVVKHIGAGELDKVTSLQTPFIGPMRDAIEKVLTDLYEYGQKQVESELDKQRSAVQGREPAKKAVPSPEQFIKTRAAATANVLGSKLRAAMAWQALRQIKAGAVDRAAMTAALTELSDRELVATAKFSVSEALNMGREAKAREMADEIGRVQYSALLDENSCGPCAEQDGKEFDYPSAEWEEVEPPYRGCEGQDRCRCVGVYIYKVERR